MAGFAAQAALRSRWGTLLDAAADSPPDLGAGVRSVVGWLKQASLEVRAAGSRAVSSLRPAHTHGAAYDGMADSLLLVHFNDVYNIEQTTNEEPVGGALRFVSAVRGLEDRGPIVLFSGDAFSPSMLSTYTKGEQMVPVLNEIGTCCAVFGNHDFDFGVEVLSGLVSRCRFPWLMSNVLDRETGRPLGDGRITHAVTHRERRVGFIGLVEQEWLETLATINPEEVTYIDFVQAGNQLAEQLKQEGCDMVIALTHMRTRNDVKLAEGCNHIDLILGGHDHVYEVLEVNNKLIVKSGTDFRQFSEITVTWSDGRPLVDVQARDVTSHYPEDEQLKPVLDEFTAMVEGKMDSVLGVFSVDLDGRFSEIRRRETNLGDWLCDVVLAATGADLVILNSGTFRSDRVHGAGGFTLRDLSSVLPMRDPLVVVAATGTQVLAALENAVSLYPSLEGRFPQVSGVSFAFDPSRPAYHRVPATLVKVGDEYLQPAALYRLAIKRYMHQGNDGFSCLKDCPLLVEEDVSPELGLCVQNHFAAIDVRTGRSKHSRHRQSLVTLSRRHSLVKLLESGSSPGTGAATPPPAHRRLSRRASLDDLEQQTCELAPRVDGRILVIDSPERLKQLELERSRHEASQVIREADEMEH